MKSLLLHTRGNVFIKKKKKVSFWKGHDLWLRKTILFKKSMEVCINLNLCLTANKIDKGDPVFIRKKIKLAILPLISVLFHDKVQFVCFTSWPVVYESIQSDYLQLRHCTQRHSSQIPQLHFDTKFASVNWFLTVPKLFIITLTLFLDISQCCMKFLFKDDCFLGNFFPFVQQIPSGFFHRS